MLRSFNLNATIVTWLLGVSLVSGVWSAVFDVLEQKPGKEHKPIPEEEFVKRCEDILNLMEQASDKLKLLQRDCAAELVRKEARKHE